MLPRATPSELQAAVHALLARAERPLLARELADGARQLLRSEVDRRDVNRALYGPLGGIVQVDRDYRWRLARRGGTSRVFAPPGAPPPEAFSEKQASTTCLEAFGRLSTHVGKRFGDLWHPSDLGPIGSKGRFGVAFEALAGGAVSSKDVDFGDGDLKSSAVAASSPLRPANPVALKNATKDIDKYLAAMSWDESPVGWKCRNLVLAGYRRSNTGSPQDHLFHYVALLRLNKNSEAGRLLADAYQDLIRQLLAKTKGGKTLRGGLKNPYLQLKAKGHPGTPATRSASGQVIFKTGLAFWLMPAFVERFVPTADIVVAPG